jgi:excisionase family DNA binding protein
MVGSMEESAADAPLLRRHDVARRLNVSLDHVDRLIVTGRLRSMRIGRLVRVSEAELARFLAGCVTEREQVAPAERRPRRHVLRPATQLVPEKSNGDFRSRLRSARTY